MVETIHLPSIWHISKMGDDSGVHQLASPLIAEILEICRGTRRGLLEAVPEPPLDFESSQRQEKVNGGDYSSGSKGPETVSQWKSPLSEAVSFKRRGNRRGRRSPQRSRPSMMRKIGNESSSSNLSHSFSSAATENISNTALRQKHFNAQVETVLDDLRRKRDDKLTPGWDYSTVSKLGSHFANKLQNGKTKGPKGILKNAATSMQSPQSLLSSVEKKNAFISSPTGVDSPISPGGTHLRGRLNRWSDHSDKSPCPAKAPLRAKSPSSKHRRSNHSRSPSCSSRRRSGGRSVSKSGRHQEASSQRRSRRSTSAASRRREPSATSKAKPEVTHRSLSPRTIRHQRVQDSKEHRSVSLSRQQHNGIDEMPNGQHDHSILGQSQSRSLSPAKRVATKPFNHTAISRQDISTSPKKIERHGRISRSPGRPSDISKVEADFVAHSRGTSGVGETGSTPPRRRHHSETRSSTPKSRSGASPSRIRRHSQPETKIDKVSQSPRHSSRNATPTGYSRSLRKVEPSDLPKPPLSPCKKPPRPKYTSVVPTGTVNDNSASSRTSQTTHESKTRIPIRQRLRIRSASPRTRSQTQTSGQKSTAERSSSQEKARDIDWRHISPRIHQGVLTKILPVYNALKDSEHSIGTNASEETLKEDASYTLDLVRSWNRAQLRNILSETNHQEFQTSVASTSVSTKDSSTRYSIDPSRSLPDSLNVQKMPSSENESCHLSLQIFDF